MRRFLIAILAVVPMLALSSLQSQVRNNQQRNQHLMPRYRCDASCCTKQKSGTSNTLATSAIART
jgi:hypothetical protein